MILTKAFLQLPEINACDEGYKFGISLMDDGIDSIDSKEVIAILEEKGQYKYAEWLRKLEVNPNAIKLSGQYEYLRYLVYNPKENKYFAVKTKERAKEIQNEIKARLIAEKFENVTHTIIQEEIKSLSGDIYRVTIAESID